MNEFFKALFTEKDGTSYDIKRVLMIPVGLISPIGLQTIAVFKGQALDVRSFCEGFALIIAALAALLAAHSMAGGENT